MTERGNDWLMTERFIPEAGLASNESSTKDPEQHAGPRRDIVQQGDAQHEAALGGLHEAPESEAETKEEASVSDRKRAIVSDLLIRLVDAAESRVHYRRNLAELKYAANNMSLAMKPREAEEIRDELKILSDIMSDKMAKCVQDVEDIQKTILVYVTD